MMVPDFMTDRERVSPVEDCSKIQRVLYQSVFVISFEKHSFHGYENFSNSPDGVQNKTVFRERAKYGKLGKEEQFAAGGSCASV